MVLKRHKVNVLGVEVDDISEKDAVLSVLKLAKDKQSFSANKKGGNYVVTVNSEFVMLARRSKDFAGILKRANLAIPDGQWVVWAKLF